jgi:hypothetical protein
MSRMGRAILLYVLFAIVLAVVMVALLWAMMRMARWRVEIIGGRGRSFEQLIGPSE